MAMTQDGRLLAIHTPLGKDFLLLQQFSVSEGLSKLFNIQVELLHEESEASYVQTVVAPNTIIGKGVTIKILQNDGTTREFCGIVNRFSQGIRNSRFSQYHASIVPYIWILTQKFQSRIFQNISVPDILGKFLPGLKFVIKFKA